MLSIMDNFYGYPQDKYSLPSIAEMKEFSYWVLNIGDCNIGDGNISDPNDGKVNNKISCKKHLSIIYGRS